MYTTTEYFFNLLIKKSLSHIQKLKIENEKKKKALNDKWSDSKSIQFQDEIKKKNHGQPVRYQMQKTMMKKKKIKNKK